MLTALPESQHYSVDEIGASLRLVFPYRGKRWHTAGLIFSTPLAWVWFAIIAIVIVLGQPGNPDVSLQAFAVRGLVFLLTSTVPLLTTLDLLWHLVGKEIVEINDDGIVIRHHILGMGLAARFKAGDIQGLFVSRPKSNWLKGWLFSRQLWYFNFKRGKIAFNCGRTIWGGVKTFRFGTSLDEVEAAQIVSLIHKRFPQYVYSRQR